MDGDPITPDPVTIDCKCGAKFTYTPMILWGKTAFVRTMCDACAVLDEERCKKEEAAKKEEAREGRWNLICPPLYRDTDPSRISQKAAQAAQEWAMDDATGLGFMGDTGKGKTRALFLALRRSFDNGDTCLAITHNKFSKTVQDAFSAEGAERKDARAILDRCQKVGVLLLDDLGKPPATERADAELEELIEHRAAHMLPILWSSNGSSAWLEKRLGPDRGAPLVRRLSQFSKVIPI